ncbi:hypothetical protein A2U01_0068429, partial [Trifolium medium]|nr:hypothetical protein [Trifolium medium]
MKLQQVLAQCNTARAVYLSGPGATRELG